MLALLYSMLYLIKTFFIVDMFFSQLHWVIDSFEYADYWLEIRSSLMHHEYPHIRGDDTYASLFNMTWKSTLAIVLFYNLLSFLFDYKIYTSIPDISAYFCFVGLAFTNHKFLHSPHSITPKLFQFLQKTILIDKNITWYTTKEIPMGKTLAFYLVN